MYRSKFYHYTFSQALKMAWYYAKCEAERLAQVEVRKAEQAAAAEARKAAYVETSRDRFYKEFNLSPMRLTETCVSVATLPSS